MSLNETEQRSQQWHMDRMGCATASRFIDIVSMSKPDRYGKSHPLKARDDYMWELVCDRLYGTPKEEISSRSLEWGTEAEPFARKAYEEETGLIVKDATFVRHSLNPFVGASPDGLVGDDGGIEGKAPKDRKVHIRTFSEGMPANHMPQVQGCMWVTGRKWWDFISFDPRPETHPEFRLYIQRIQRDDIYIAKLDESVSAFLAEVSVTVKEMLEKIRRSA